MLEEQSWTMRGYLAVRELSVIGPVQGVQRIPAAAHGLLWSMVGNNAKAQAWFFNSPHVDVRFSPLSLNFAVVAPLCLKFPHLRDYGMLKPGVSIWAQRSQTRRLTANRIPLVKTDTCTVYSGLNNQQCGISTTWQMSLVHLLGLIVRDSCLSAYGKSMDLYPARTTTGVDSHCWARKYRHKPRRTLKPLFHVSGVLMTWHCNNMRTHFSLCGWI